MVYGKPLDALPGGASWQEQVEAQMTTLRTSITREPRGAVLLAESPTVLSLGARAHGAAAASAAGAGAATSAAAAADPDLAAGAAYLERFPAAMAGAAAHDDEQFLASVRLICAGIATLIRPGESA